MRRSSRQAQLAVVALLTLLTLVACGQAEPQVRPVTVSIQGVTPQGMALASTPSLPYATAMLLDCDTVMDCEGAEAIGFETIGSEGAAVRMTGERCETGSDTSACELLFTPDNPKVTAWLKDGTYALSTRAFADPSGVYTEYCISGGPVMFDVGPGRNNAVSVTLAECSPADGGVIYFDSSSPAGGDGSKATPHASLAEAIAAAPLGGTVVILSGSHTIDEELVIDKALTLIGAPSPTMTPGAVNIASHQNPELLLTAAGIRISGDNGTIRNLDVEVTASNQPGIHVHNEAGPLSGLLLDSIAITVTSGHGILLEDVNEARLQNITTSFSGEPESAPATVGIRIEGGNNVTLEKLDASSPHPGGAIGLYSTPTRPLGNVHIDTDTINALPNTAASPPRRGLFTWRDGAALNPTIYATGLPYTVSSAKTTNEGGCPQFGPEYTDIVVNIDSAFALATCGNAGESSFIREQHTDEAGRLTPKARLTVGAGMSIQVAINAAGTGDIVHLQPGTELTGTLHVNKNITLSGDNGTHSDTTLTIAPDIPLAIAVSAPATIDRLELEMLEDSTGTIIQVTSSDVSITNNTMHGKFPADNLNASAVSRALVVAHNVARLEVAGNRIYSLRQPAYINPGASGIARDNTVFKTFGWVVDGASIDFIDNYWNETNTHGEVSGNSKCDIALLDGTTYEAPYADLQLLASQNGGVLLNLGSGDNSCDQRTPVNP